MDVAEQVAILYAATNGFLDSYQTEKIKVYESELIEFLNSSADAVLAEIRSGAKLKGELKTKLHNAINEFDERFHG